ncbi:hypothetical protein [Zavarzinella formosa]|uniref:hypothetical protein n=1 Tax=Zavarzinella formosa TaxID=360055 RepID=UPI0002E70386|nr:hypothetical protein [Zavarzinella formosa]
MNWADFYRHLFQTGEAVLYDRPDESPVPDEDTANLLRTRFMQRRADLAGSLIDFDLPAAWSAARFTALGCWFLTSREEPESELKRLLADAPKPRTAAEHLSADLTLRYLVTVHRRAESLHVDDPLTIRLREVLRECPLTGAMAGELDPPTGDMTLGGHAGLRMLYAERLMGAFKSGWWPEDGPICEMAELVFQQAGRAIPAPVETRAV